MKKLLAALIFCFALTASGQKILLDNKVAGQLPLKNADKLVNRMQAMGNTGASFRGIYAQSGMVDSWQPDLYCTNGALPGFNVQSNVACSSGYLHYQTAGAYYGFRNVYLGATNAYPFPASAFSFHFTAVLGSSGQPQGQYVGFNACAVSDWTCAQNGSADMMAYVDSTGIGLSWNGTKTLLFPLGQLSTRLIGSNPQQDGYGDDGFPWAPFQQGFLYEITVTHPGDGTVSLSVAAADGTDQFCFASANVCSVASTKISVTDPSSPIHQFGFRGSQGADFISNLGYAASPMYQRVPRYDVAPGHASGWLYTAALHADGSELAKYDGSPCPDCQDVFVWVPPSYNPNAPNPVVIHVKGNESSLLSALGTFDNQTSQDKPLDALMQAG